MARASAAGEAPGQVGGRVSVRPQWVFAAAAGIVLVLGAAAYAGRAWMGVPSPAPTHAAPSGSSGAGEARPRAGVSAAREIEAPAPVVPDAPHRRRTVGRTSAAMVRPTNAELELLRTARQGVTRGDFTGALAVIAEHGRKFRNGSLVEEREALRVKSLAGLGRHEEAQRAAARFHARFPHSVFLATFNRMKEADR